MFGFFRVRSPRADEADAAVALEGLVAHTLKSLGEGGTEFQSHAAVLRAALIVVCETFVDENSGFDEDQRVAILRIAARVDSFDSDGRHALLTTNMYENCEAKACTIDDLMALTGANEVFRCAVGSGENVPGLPEVMGRVAATKWTLRYFVMACRLILAEAVREKELAKRIRYSLEQMSKSASG